MRDIGPTFTTGPAGPRAVDCTFNGWGAQPWARWGRDAAVTGRVAALADIG